MKPRQYFKKRLFDFIYSLPFEIFIILCILLSIVLLLVDAGTQATVGSQVWIARTEHILNVLFIIEYAMRFLLATHKGVFFKKHVIDLIALLPILRIFRLLRIVRLIRILKFVKSDRWQHALSRSSDGLALARKEKSIEISMAALGLLAIILWGSVGILYFEQGKSDQYQSLWDGIWWSVVTLTTVGYGDKFPITLGGRALATLIMIMGLSFFALMTGGVSSFIIERYKKEENSGMDLLGIKNHIIICGWNDHGMTVLQELRDLYQDELKHFIIIAEQKPALPMFEQIHFIQGDFTKNEVLHKAQVQKAESVLILADKTNDRHAQDMDARTILATMAVEKLNAAVYTCAELIASENIEHLKNAEVDEYITASQYTGNLMAHSVKNHGLTRVYQELLQCREGNRIYKLKIPPSCENKPFDECAVMILQQHQAILIGIESQGEYMINPEKKKVGAGDQFVYIAKKKMML
jgi:voltage-gated potassium channel